MISNEEILEIVAEIQELNYKLGEKAWDEGISINLTTNGTCAIIEFMGMQIWSSEEDDRWHEDNDEYESWEDSGKKDKQNDR